MYSVFEIYFLTTWTQPRPARVALSTSLWNQPVHTVPQGIKYGSGRSWPLKSELSQALQRHIKSHFSSAIPRCIKSSISLTGPHRHCAELLGVFSPRGRHTKFQKTEYICVFSCYNKYRKWNWAQPHSSTQYWTLTTEYPQQLVSHLMWSTLSRLYQVGNHIISGHCIVWQSYKTYGKGVYYVYEWTVWNN